MRLSRLFSHRKKKHNRVQRHVVDISFVGCNLHNSRHGHAGLAQSQAGAQLLRECQPTLVAPVPGHPNRAGYPIRPRLEYFCLVGVLFTHCCHQHVLLLASFFWNNNRRYFVCRMPNTRRPSAQSTLQSLPPSNSAQSGIRLNNGSTTWHQGRWPLARCYASPWLRTG